MGDLAAQLDRFLRRAPTLGRGAYLALGARVVGDVTLGDGCSVWYNAVLRGDLNRIVIGRGSNIQDNAVLHVADAFPCLVGCHVTVGHSATVHGCTVRDEVVIGMGATILDGATIGEQCIIGANALVAENAEVPPGSLVLGVPAKVVRTLTSEERQGLRRLAGKYVEMAAYCLRHQIGVSAPIPS
jgi:gamma-carbonic anhydrase